MSSKTSVPRRRVAQPACVATCLPRSGQRLDLLSRTDPDSRIGRYWTRAAPKACSPVTLKADRFGSVPRACVHTRQDQAVPYRLQQAMPEAAGGARSVFGLDSGRSPMPSQPQALADVLARLAAEVVDASLPVTVVVTRRVRAGCEPAYEAWLQRLQAEARGLPGYLGVTTQRPAAAAPRDYVSVIRFATLADLQAFEGSALRRRFMAEVVDLVEGDATWQRLTGLEFWFTPPAGMAVPQPSRARMALLLTAVVFLLVLTIGRAVDAAAGALPFALPGPLRLFITIVLEVLLMTYWLMPVLTRRLARWIYPRA